MSSVEVRLCVATSGGFPQPSFVILPSFPKCLLSSCLPLSSYFISSYLFSSTRAISSCLFTLSALYTLVSFSPPSSFLPFFFAFRQQFPRVSNLAAVFLHSPGSFPGSLALLTYRAPFRFPKVRPRNVCVVLRERKSKRIRRPELASLRGAIHSRRGKERIRKERLKSKRDKESVRENKN